MPLLNNFRPGVNSGVVSVSRVARPQAFRTVMIVGSAASGPINEPTIVEDYADYLLQFPGSTQEDWMRMYFAEKGASTNAIQYFVRAGVTKRFDVAVSSVADGPYTLTINGVAVTVEAEGTETIAQLVTLIAAAVNASVAGGAVNATGDLDSVLVRAEDPRDNLTVTVTAGNMVATNTTPLTPDATDYVYAITNSFKAESDPLSFLAVPAAPSFTGTTLAAVRGAMVSACTSLGWFTFLDCSNVVAEQKVQAALADKTTCPASRHASYVWPQVVNTLAVNVPASAAIIGAAMRLYAIVGRGIKDPPCGAAASFNTVAGISTNTSDSDSEVASQNRINVIRNIRNVGITMWDMYTLSTDSNFQFIHTNLITSIISKTIDDVLVQFLFQNVGNSGQRLVEIDAVVSKFMADAYNAGLLQGTSGVTSSYDVQFNYDAENQAAIEQGVIYGKIAYTPVGAIRQIAYTLARSPLGQIQQTLDSIG